MILQAAAHETGEEGWAEARLRGGARCMPLPGELRGSNKDSGSKTLGVFDITGEKIVFYNLVDNGQRRTSSRKKGGKE